MGTPETDRKKRQDLRRRLRAEGLSADEIDWRVAEYQAERRRAGIDGVPGPKAQNPPGKRAKNKLAWAETERLAAERDIAQLDPALRAKLALIDAERAGLREQKARALYAAQPEQPDDTKYRPRHVDSTLKGAARATGDAAKSIRRGRALTKWETT